VIGLNHREKDNAISCRLVKVIARDVEHAGTEAKAAVSFGHGAQFCAGLDLAEHVGKTPLEDDRGLRRRHQAFSRVDFGPTPWFMALRGALVGGGLELAASGHVRIADERAFFALPEVTRGIFVASGSGGRVARLTGTARMPDMMLSGRSINAQTAQEWNILRYVLLTGKALAQSFELVKKATSNAELSIHAVINALPRIHAMARDTSFTATSPEAEQRLTAFLPKNAGKVIRPDGTA